MNNDDTHSCNQSSEFLPTVPVYIYGRLFYLFQSDTVHVGERKTVDTYVTTAVHHIIFSKECALNRAYDGMYVLSFSDSLWHTRVVGSR